MWPGRQRGGEERNWWLEVGRTAQGDLLKRVNEKWEGAARKVWPQEVFCSVLFCLGFTMGQITA